MTVLPKAIYIFHAILVACFAEIEKPVLKCMWSFRGPPNSTISLLKEEHSFKIYTWKLQISKFTAKL